MCNMTEVKNNVNQLYLYYLGTVGDIMRLLTTQSKLKSNWSKLCLQGDINCCFLCYTIDPFN